jgi:hypothetical protein
MAYFVPWFGLRIEETDGRRQGTKERRTRVLLFPHDLERTRQEIEDELVMGNGRELSPMVAR